jgi:hypothetical protein
MSFSIHQASIPVFIQTMTAMSAILDKAVAHCESRKIDPAVLINYRLAPDMFPLSRQIQIMCDMAKGAGARLAGVAVPSDPDVETSFDELKARIAKTSGFLAGLDAAAINDSAGKTVTLKVGGQEIAFVGGQYLSHFALPNFFFHAATAYDILRHAGLPLSKGDFLGGR